MNIHVTELLNYDDYPQREAFVESQLITGQFHEPDEVIEMAFRLLEKSTIDDAEWVKSVREKVTIARLEVARGKALDGPSVVNEILDRFRQAKEARS